MTQPESKDPPAHRGASSRTRLSSGTWADAEALIGKPFPSVAGADAVEAGAVRRRLEVLEWDCPLHTDRATAIHLGYRDIIAPATMTGIFAMPAYWQPGDPPMYEDGLAKLPPLFLDHIPAPGQRMVATGWSLRHHRYLHPGDRVKGTTTVARIDRKRTRLGDGAFITLQTEYFDTDDELVATRELTVFRF